MQGYYSRRLTRLPQPQQQYESNSNIGGSNLAGEQPRGAATVTDTTAATTRQPHDRIKNLGRYAHPKRR